MLTVVLEILKIIGIVLLFIVGLILLLILLILFVPFRYKLYGDNKEKNIEEDKNVIKAGVVISWLLSIVRVNIYYKEQVNAVVRIFGIPIYDKARRSKKNDDSDIFNDNELSDFDSSDYFNDISDSKTDLKSDSETKPEAHADISSDDINSDIIKSDSLGDPGNSDDLDDSENSEKSDNGDAPKNKENIFKKLFGHKKKKTFGEFLEELFSKIKKFIIDLFEKLQKAVQKPKEMVEKAADTYIYYDNLLNKKGTKYVVDFLKKEIKIILNSIRPRRCRIEAHYGSTDPEKCAKMFELYGILHVFLNGKNDISIDFEDDYLSFDIWIKGRIFLCVLAIHGLKIILNKKVRKFIRLVKREGVNG